MPAMTSNVFLGDAMVTGTWIFISSIFEELSALASSAFNISPMSAGLTVLCTGLALYEPICKAIGGNEASFSPAVNFALAGAGKGGVRHHTLRSIAQAVGGALGAFLAIKAFPQSWQGKFSNYAHGVMPGNTLLSGFLAEAVLSFILNVSILWAMETRFKAAGFKAAGRLAPYMATIALIPAGADYSGPFMNPAVAFSWYWNLQGTTAWEHFVVFWAGCLTGSYFAGWSWKAFSPPSKIKAQEADAQAKKKTAVDASRSERSEEGSSTAKTK